MFGAVILMTTLLWNLLNNYLEKNLSRKHTDFRAIDERLTEDNFEVSNTTFFCTKCSSFKGVVVNKLFNDLWRCVCK